MEGSNSRSYFPLFKYNDIKVSFYTESPLQQQGNRCRENYSFMGVFAEAEILTLLVILMQRNILVDRSNRTR